MTLPQVAELVDYWRRQPPTHVLVVAYLGCEAPKTIEEQWAQGALSPADFLEHFKRTGGKVDDRR